MIGLEEQIKDFSSTLLFFYFFSFDWVIVKYNFEFKKIIEL